MDIIYTEHSYFECRTKIINKTFEACIVKHNNYAKDIIFELVKNNIPFHKVNYGAGVFKIIKNGLPCEHCQGKGY